MLFEFFINKLLKVIDYVRNILQMLIHFMLSNVI